MLTNYYFKTILVVNLKKNCKTVNASVLYIGSKMNLQKYSTLKGLNTFAHYKGGGVYH